MITEFLYNWQLSRRRMRNEGVIFVTDLVRCPLKREYELKFPEIANSSLLNPSNLIGDLVHEGLERVIDIGNYKKETEVEVSKDFFIEGKKVTIHGRIDLLFKSEKEILVVEIKTSKRDIGIPKENHVLQLKIYMNLLNTSRGILVYFTNDRIAEFIIEGQISDEEMEGLISDHLRLYPTPKYNWECRYCYFSAFCPYAKK